jgi:hypothetical protein
VPALAPGEARRLTSRFLVGRAALIRAVPRLGFFVCVAALAACNLGDAHARAAAADRQYRTGVFTWLVEHDPSAVVAWGVPAARISALIPDARVVAADSGAPCRQALAAHAALLLLAPRANRLLRERAEGCGFAIFRDDGALVVAPLGR